MAQKNIGTGWDRESRNAMNDNFDELYASLIGAGNSAADAERLAREAVATAKAAKLEAEGVQDQLDRIIIDSGTSDAEVIQARKEYPLLKDRLDASDTQLADNVKYVDANISDFRDGFYAGPVVAFVFDDGRTAMWDLFKDLFESEGVPANVPVVTDFIDTHPLYMTTPQLKELQDLGWGISSHMATHLNVYDISPEEIDREYREASEWLKERGFSSDIIVYPYGATNTISRKIASKYYKMGVNIVRNNISNDIPNINNLDLNRLAGLSQPSGAGPTYNEMKQRFDIGVVRNELMIYEDHPQYPDWTPEKIEELRTFIRYIKSQGVPIVTLDDAFQMKCNIIDVGERSEGNFYKLHRNGQTSGGDDVFNLAPSDAFDMGDTPDAYPNAKITMYRINNNLIGLPLLSSGEITFDKTSIYPNNWVMDFTTLGHQFYRQWFNGEWTRWYSYGEVIGDSHISNLPPANATNWRRHMLVRGHNGHEDKAIICTRNEDSTYSWKEIALTEYI